MSKTYKFGTLFGIFEVFGALVSSVSSSHGGGLPGTLVLFSFS